MRHKNPNTGIVFTDWRITLPLSLRNEMKIKQGDFYEISLSGKDTFTIQLHVNITAKTPNNGTVIANGRITLPQELRKKAEVKAGDFYEVTKIDENTLTVKVKKPQSHEEDKIGELSIEEEKGL